MPRIVNYGIRWYSELVRSTRLVFVGWGATLLLFVLSILAALRLGSIGAETINLVADASFRDANATADVVAVIEPAGVDHLSTVIRPALDAARQDARYPFRVFSPGLPSFLAESSAMIQTLDIAYEAGVDAVLVRPDRLESLERASRIAAGGLLTAVIGTLVPRSATQIRVGADPEDYARLVASSITPDLGTGAKVGYLCGLCAGAEADTANQLVRAVEAAPEFQAASLSPIVVQGVDDVELGSVAAARSLLLRQVDAVFCDTTEATIAMAQVVVDANLVGSVRIIGFGASERVLSLVDDRVVHATITGDYAGAVEEAFAVMVDLLAGLNVHGVVSSDRPVLVVPPLSRVGPEIDS